MQAMPRWEIDSLNYSVDAGSGDETVIQLWRTYSANDLMQYVPPGANNGDENRVADFIYDEMLNDMGLLFRYLYGQGSFPEIDGYDKFGWDWQDVSGGIRVVAEVRLDDDDMKILSKWAKLWNGEEEEDAG